jgi:hypothetical protein
MTSAETGFDLAQQPWQLDRLGIKIPASRFGALGTVSLPKKRVAVAEQAAIP